MGREGEAQGRQAKLGRRRGGEPRARLGQGALRPQPDTLPASEDVLKKCPGFQNNMQSEQQVYRLITG